VKLLARYGRRTLEEVFLDVARGRGIEREPHNDGSRRRRFGFFPAAHRRDDAALLVSPALVVAAAPRPRLLADGADGYLGLLQFYITQNAGFFAQAAGTFIGAVLLWDILFRGQLGFSISFMEEDVGAQHRQT